MEGVGSPREQEQVSSCLGPIIVRNNLASLHDVIDWFTITLCWTRS